MPDPSPIRAMILVSSRPLFRLGPMRRISTWLCSHKEFIYWLRRSRHHFTRVFFIVIHVSSVSSTHVLVELHVRWTPRRILVLPEIQMSTERESTRRKRNDPIVISSTNMTCFFAARGGVQRPTASYRAAPGTSAAEEHHGSRTNDQGFWSERMIR